MDECAFLDVEDVIDIHQDQIAEHGGSAGIRDMGLLEWAVAMPATRYLGEYTHRTVFEMAGAYLFHLSRNHPFLDGNKRVAAAAAETFLLINGIEMWADEPEYSEFVLAVARGDVAKQDVAEFYECNSRKL